MSPDTLLRAREAIGDRTPMCFDCGALCGAACCQSDADGQGGVHLFPGEEALLEGCGWGRIVPDSLAPMLVCQGVCDRAARPLGCRIFPLTPVRGKNGLWTVRMDARARAMCPLAAHGLSGLDPAFPRAVREALRIVAGEAEGNAFLEKWAALEAEYRRPLW
jgi:hypothetical protein